MDGTCDLMGETLYFRVSNFSLYTGTAPDNMTITHKISVLDKKGMSLRDQRDGQDVLYKLSRTDDFALPQMELPQMEQPEDVQSEPAAEPTAEPTVQPAAEATAAPELEELLVTEEEDAE